MNDLTPVVTPTRLRTTSHRHQTLKIEGDDAFLLCFYE